MPKTTQDRILLTGISAEGFHGVFEHERRDGQTFVVDAVLTIDLTEAGRTDALADTVHYGELAQAIADDIAGPPLNLIEALAHRIATTCLADARVTEAIVTVHKPQAPVPVPFQDVAVTVTRRRNP